MVTTVVTRNGIEAAQQEQEPRNWTVVEEQPALTCRCCNPGSTLIPRAGQGEGQRYALCLRSGRMHVIAGGEVQLLTRPQPDRGGEGGGRPDLAPGVRVDLSRDTYALTTEG